LTASKVCAKVAHPHMHTHTHGQLRWGLTNSSDCGHTVWASREAIYPLLDQEKYVHVIASLGWSMSHMQIKKVKRTHHAQTQYLQELSLAKAKRSRQRTLRWTSWVTFSV